MATCREAVVPRSRPTNLPRSPNGSTKGAVHGPDPNAMLDTLSPASKEAAKANKKSPGVEIVRATGKEPVLFSRDIAPLLIEHCGSCHAAPNPPMNFGMNSFRRLLDGGQSGPPIVPGKPDDSLLVQKIRGTATKVRGCRSIIRRWNPRKSKRSPSGSSSTPASTARTPGCVRRSGGDRLFANRVARRAQPPPRTLAERNWRIALPDLKPERAETKNFLVLGTLGQERLHEIGELAEQQVSAAAKGGSSSRPTSRSSKDG